MTTQARELAGIITNAGDLLFDDDVTLQSDGAVLNFGVDSDVTLTHVADTALLLNSTRRLQFGDSGTYINQSADGVLNLTSDTEVEINATTIDINGNVDASGTLVVAGVLTGASLDISGDIDIDGTSNLDVVDIDGAVDMASTLAVAGVLSPANHIDMPSDAIIKLGGSDEFQITYDSGGSAILTESGSGNMKLRATNLDIEAHDGNTKLATFVRLGAVSLYHNNAVKLATVTGGVHLGTGSVNATLSTESAGTSNLTLGVNAGNSIESGGNYNVCVGDEAGTAISTGDDNVAIGYAALYTNTTGEKLTALGKDALLANTTAGNNTAVGYASLTANTTGTSSVAVGVNALLVNTTGADNTALGKDSLKANTTASNNTAVGKDTLAANTTGTSNTAVGYNSLAGVTTGTDNVSVGDTTNITVTTGNYSACLGSGNSVDSTDAQSRHTIGAFVANPTDNSIRIGSGGNYITNTFTSNATWAHSSDERLKENIVDDDLGLSFINDLRTVTFNWRKQEDVSSELNSNEKFEKDTENKKHGMIAQEVKAALDKQGVDTFTGWEEDGLDGVQLISESMFVFPLIKAIQELSAEVEELKSQPVCKCKGE